MARTHFHSMDHIKMTVNIKALQGKRKMKMNQYEQLITRSKKVHSEINEIDQEIQKLEDSLTLSQFVQTDQQEENAIAIISSRISRETQTDQALQFYQHINSSMNKINQTLVREFIFSFLIYTSANVYFFRCF